jgi:AraC-like DNA-binding protein
MANSLIKDINNYIAYLNSKNLSISVHGKIVSGLLEHNLHINPYCSFIKTNDEAWDKCVKCQQRVFNACNNDCLFGMCWAGVEEYVFYVDSKTFISVSGYGIDKEKATARINRLSREFKFNISELEDVYNNGLKHQKENFSELNVLIKPLCYMLSLLQLSLGDVAKIESKNKLFDSILAFVQRNIMHDISLRNIADACACSESTVSHLFKQYTNQSVKKYINSLRIKQAEKLLATSDLPIGKIANLCGYADTNYFSTAFKKQWGVSPKMYRERL